MPRSGEGRKCNRQTPGRQMERHKSKNFAAWLWPLTSHSTVCRAFLRQQGVSAAIWAWDCQSFACHEGLNASLFSSGNCWLLHKRVPQLTLETMKMSKTGLLELGARFSIMKLVGFIYRVREGS